MDVKHLKSMKLRTPSPINGYFYTHGIPNWHFFLRSFSVACSSQKSVTEKGRVGNTDVEGIKYPGLPGTV